MRLALECLLSKFESAALAGPYERLCDVDVGNWGFRYLPVTFKKRHDGSKKLTETAVL